MEEQLRPGRGGWRRLGLEGFVIVVSILLAFALDAAWDGHLERRQLASNLALLNEQLAANSEEMSRAIDRNVETLGLLEIFLMSTPGELRAMPVDTLRSITAAFRGHGIYDQDGMVVNGFVAGGLLDLVHESDLRGNLMAWSTLPQELETDYAAIPSAQEALRSFLIDYAVVSAEEGVPGANGLDEAVSNLRSDPGAVEAVLHRLRAISSYNENLKAFREDLFEALATQLKGQ